MGDTKIAALIFIFLGAFFLWLHSQGKLIPLFQQLFGVGLYGQKAKAAPVTSAAPAGASSTAANPVLSVLLGAAGAATQQRKQDAPQKIDPAHDITGTLPGW